MACEPVATGEQLLEAYPDLAAITVEEAGVAIEAATLLLGSMVGGRPLRRCSYGLRVSSPNDCWVGPSVGYRTQGVADHILLPDGVTDVAAVTADGDPVTGWTVRRKMYGLELAQGSASPFVIPRVGSDSFVVTVISGTEPNRLTRMAVLELAADIASHSLPSDCAMDANVTYLAAQGVFKTFDADAEYDERFESVVRVVTAFGSTPEAGIYTPGNHEFEYVPSDDVSAWTP